MAKILYLTINDLEKSFEKNKYGIDFLKKSNEVKILNILNYVPNLYLESFFGMTLNWKKVRRIINSINLFKPSFLCVEVPCTNLSTAIILLIVLSSIKKVKLIYLENGILPKVKTTKKSLFDQFHPRIASLISSIFHKYTKKEIIYCRIKNVQKLKKNHYEIIIPSRDADRYLEESNSLIKSEQIISFIDQMFIDHPDLNLINNLKTLNYFNDFKNKINYYEEINYCLLILNQKLNLPIHICKHPKHNILDASKKFNYEISKLNTLKTISRSKIVIAHNSTAINFAILLNKPIILYESESHNYSPYHKYSMQAFQRELGLELFNKKTISNFDSNNIKIDYKKYEKYKETYILKKDILSPSYKILNAFINQIKINN